MGDGGLENLERWMKKSPQTRLIIIDTWVRFKPKTKGGGNAYDVDTEALAPLQAFALEHGVAVLLLHHDRKMQSEDIYDSISGSTGLTGVADGNLFLRRVRGESEAELTITGRDIEEERTVRLKWDKKLATWGMIGEAEVTGLTGERREMYELLKSQGAMTPTEVAKLTGKSANTVRQLLYQMSRIGQLSAVGGAYSVPSPGCSNNRSAEGEEV